MKSGSTAASALRRVGAATSAPAWPTTYATSRLPVAPSLRTITAHASTPGTAPSRASISPSSMRKPRSLIC